MTQARLVNTNHALLPIIVPNHENQAADQKDKQLSTNIMEAKFNNALILYLKIIIQKFKKLTKLTKKKIHGLALIHRSQK
jgi:hypothetical protein